MRAAWLALLASGCLALVGSDDGSPVQQPGPHDDHGVTVFLTGGERGALEPCGCATGQLGGLARRSTVLALERPDPAAALTLSCGGLLRDTSALDALTLQTAMQALGAMAYDAHVPSARELALGHEALEAGRRSGVPWLAANVVSKDGDRRAATQPLFVKTVGDHIVSVIGLVLPEDPAPTEFVITDPLAALEASRPTPGSTPVIVVSGAIADVRALMSRASSRWAETLVLVGDPQGGPTTRPLDDHIISSGQRGHYMLVAYAGHAHDAPRVIPLDESWPSDPSMGVLIAIHRQRIVMEGVLDDLYERTDPPGGLGYVGPEACADCHAEAFAAHAGSRHSHAIDSLRPEERFLDPDCLACHSTGFGLKTGFAGLDKTPDLARVGCESCHGPGSAHVIEPFQQKMIKDVRCTTCHDAENSPDFDRAEYWPKVRHGL